MKVSIDTKEDSHEDIRKVIRMLQNIVGETQEVFTNQPQPTSEETTASPFANIFGDTATPSTTTPTETTTPETKEEIEETSESTEDLFAELFSEEELKKMNHAEVKEEEKEEVDIKSKNKKFSIEFY